MPQSNSASLAEKVVFAPGAPGLLKVAFREQGDTRIVDVAGGVDLNTSPLLRQLLFEAIGEAPKVALNLAEISFLDSSGVAVLLEALLESQRRHGQFVLFGMNPMVCDDFRITHVGKVFQVADSEEQALAGMVKVPGTRNH
jgi:anti-sigma B factor antagonist